MKLTKFTLSFCLPVLMMTACASIPKYETPSPNSTRLRVALVEGAVSNLPNDLTGETMFVKIYDQASCENEREFGYLHSPNDRKTKAGKLNMPLGAYGKSAVHEALIEANKKLRVEVSFAILKGSPLFGTVEKCDISIDYMFEKGTDYEFVGVLETFNSCSVEINKLVNVNNQPARQTVKTLTQIDHPIPEVCAIKKADE